MSEFTFKQSNASNSYHELIFKGSKPWAAIVEIREGRNTYYHASRIDGCKFSRPTIVELKELLFADQNEAREIARLDTVVKGRGRTTKEKISPFYSLPPAL